MRFSEYLNEMLQEANYDEMSPAMSLILRACHDHKENMTEGRIDVLGSRLAAHKKLEKIGPTLNELLGPDLHHSNYSAIKHHVTRQFDPNFPTNSRTAFSYKGQGSPKHDKDALEVLRGGGVVAFVTPPDAPKVTHIRDHLTGDLFHVTDGDEDDWVGGRHDQLKLPNHHGLGVGINSGVGSQLKLKGHEWAGIKDKGAGLVVSPDEHGHIVLNHPDHKRQPMEEPPIDWTKTPKSKIIRDNIHAEIAENRKGVNLTSHMRNGVANALYDMSKETPKESRIKLREARARRVDYYSRIGASVPKNMITPNGKMKKSANVGMITLGLSLAPHNISGIDQCHGSDVNCRVPCLGTEAGMNKIQQDHVRSSQLAKTGHLFADPEGHTRIKVAELRNHLKLTKETFSDTRLEPAHEAYEADRRSPKKKGPAPKHPMFKKKFASDAHRESWLKQNPHIRSFVAGYRDDVLSDHGATDGIYKTRPANK